jgi:hypothetical protein
MADKFRTTFVIPVSFASGEQPTSVKLNSISTQSRNGLAILERAIGDLWNQSGDSITSAYPNHIANLARAVGDQALLNAQIPLPNFNGTASVRIRQPIVTFLGKSEIHLDFKPQVDSTLRSSIDALQYDGSNTYDASEVTNPTTDGQWAVDSSQARIRLGRALHTVQAVDYIEYNVLAADFAESSDSLDSSSFSIIPNQDQSDWKGLKICQITANQYNIVLPFRRPDSAPAGLSKLPLSANNSAEVGSPSTIRYWGPIAAGYVFNATISSNKFYRYTLSQVVMDLFTSSVAGTIIPSGTLYLWDTVTDTVVEGITFKVPSVTPTLGGVSGQQPFILQADGASLDQVFNGPNGDFTSLMTTDVPADYQSRFALICVGQSLAASVNQLKKDLTEGSNILGPRKRISHRDLIETQPTQQTRHPTNIPPSFITGDDHSYLLSRLGSAETATTSAHRDRFNNGILGNLLLLSSSSSSNYQNLSAASNYIYFGSVSSSSPRIRGNPGAISSAPAGVAQNAFTIDNASLDVSTGIIQLSSGKLRSYNGTDLAMFNGSGNHSSGAFWTQRTIFNGTTQSLSTFTASLNSTRYIDIDATSSNLVSFKGQDLDISAASGDSNDVVIGDNNTSTQLRLKNNILVFGKTTDITIPGQARLYRSAGNILTFQEDADGNNLFSTAGAKLRAGALIASDGEIHFDSDATENDKIAFDDTTNNFDFYADNSINSSIVNAGRIVATQGHYYSPAKEAAVRFKIDPVYVDKGSGGQNTWYRARGDVPLMAEFNEVDWYTVDLTNDFTEHRIAFWLPAPVSVSYIRKMRFSMHIDGLAVPITFTARCSLASADETAWQFGGLTVETSEDDSAGLVNNDDATFEFDFGSPGIFDVGGRKIEGMFLQFKISVPGPVTANLYVHSAKVTYVSSRSSIFDD